MATKITTNTKGRESSTNLHKYSQMALAWWGGRGGKCFCVAETDCLLSVFWKGVFMKMELVIGGVVAAMPMGMGTGSVRAAHVHFFVDAQGGQLVFEPSDGNFAVVGGTRKYSETFGATGAADAYLPGIAVSAPTITTLENFDGEQSFDIENHEVGVRVLEITPVAGAGATTLTWLITAPPKDAGEDVGNPADQTVTASVVPDGLGGWTTDVTGTMDFGPLDNGVPTGNHWHGQHWTFSNAGLYDVSFQLFDMNATNGLGAADGVLGDSPVYTVEFVAPEPASLGVLGVGALALLRRRRR
jgi:hypothetical protein